MLSNEQKEQFSDILEELGRTLDITKEQHDAAVTSYKFVGEWLSQEGSPISQYSPEVLPQGSFLLQTMIKPIHEEDELDIDLVCKLEKVGVQWTQYELKKIIDDRLADHGTLKKLLVVPDGKRCWTLQYAESAKFHLDVLPSVVVTGYNTILEKAFSANEFSDAEKLGIRITDRTLPNYKTSTNLREWMKSNPFGYAFWFQGRASLNLIKAKLFSESVRPVPDFQKDKLPLQRVVQILKRHRDLMFNGEEKKPISIIITTLAAKAYNKETNILEALVSVVEKMPNFIEERYSAQLGRKIKWISNPANEEENFADRWLIDPERQTNFYKWLDAVRVDVNSIVGQSGRGIQMISESMAKSFGKDTVTKMMTNYAERNRLMRESGNMKITTKTGTILGAGTTTVKNHNFYGKEEQ